MRLLKRIYRWFFPEVTYEWCLVGNTIGKHTWTVKKCKCYDGTPEGAGWFLTFYKCPDEKAARKLLSGFKEEAEKINKRNGY